LLWLRDELANYPSVDQKILHLRAVDCSYDEIAKSLGIKVGTARVRYLRAKNKIIAAADRVALFDPIAPHDAVESGALHE
jgi:DNA-directed RNA polymerase specialized sigma24 family protein